MNRPLVVIYGAIVLDAVGIGLVFPILPRLLEEVTHSQNIALYIGIMTALYAVMQFIFAPMLGALSDNLGRRPVLLVSLAGAAVNYVILAFAPQLWLLMVGRAFAGITSANVARIFARSSTIALVLPRPTDRGKNPAAQVRRRDRIYFEDSRPTCVEKSLKRASVPHSGHTPLTLPVRS